MTRRGLILAAPAIVAATALGFRYGEARAAGQKSGELIVRLKVGVTPADVATILARHGATLGASFAPIAPRDYHVLCRADREADLAAELRASGLVESARFVPVAYQAAAPNDPAYHNDAWFSAINAPTVWDRFKMSDFGSMPPCIDIDSGLAGTYSGGVFTPTHLDLVTQVTQTYNAITGTADVTETAGNYHGDAVLGIMAAASNNSIAVPSVGWGGTGIAIKALSFTDHIAAMNWIIANITPPSFITLPWYYGSTPNPTLTTAAAALYNAGHLLIGSSGDGGVTPCNFGTADIPDPYAITVTACGVNTGVPPYARVTSYASYGPSRDGTGAGANACAPGGNNTGTPPPADFFDTIKVNTSTNYSASAVGTSFSAPVIAGIARVLAVIAPSLTISQIRDIMTDQSLTIETTGFGTSPIGCVDFAAVVDVALTMATQNNGARPWFLRRGT